MAGKSHASPTPAGALRPAKLASLLTQAGGAKVTAAEIRADVAAGAPQLPAGSIPLLPYIAWLHAKVATGGT
jgi:hypothetical protein